MKSNVFTVGFEKSFEHSQELFDASIKEFSDKGYARASLNTILENAGMSKGQFYYHFKNKEDLYFALIEILISKKRAFLSSVMEPDDLQRDIFNTFKTQIKYGMAFARRYPGINRFSKGFIEEKGSPIYKKVMAKYDFESDDFINELIEESLLKGDFRKDLPSWFIKKVIRHLFTHAPELAGLESAEDVENNMNYLIEFMKSGLASRE